MSPGPRYNAPCKDACESRGEDYFWCHTSDSWDYCSPKGDFIAWNENERELQKLKDVPVDQMLLQGSNCLFCETQEKKSLNLFF